MHGKQVDCHCFGALSRAPVSWWSVVRNAVFLLLAGLVLAGGTSQGWPWQVLSDQLDPLTTSERWLWGLVALLTVGVVVLAVLFAALLRRYGHVLLRLEELEASPASRGHEHDHAHDFAAWPAPDVDVFDADGAAMGLRDVAATDRANLLVFVSPQCQACGELVDELGQWQAEDDEASRSWS